MKAFGRNMKNTLRDDFMEELSDFINSHDHVSTHRFMIYGLPTEEEIAIIVKGLFFQLDTMGVNLKRQGMIFVEEVDEETAVVFNQYRGVALTFALSSKKDLSEAIKIIVLDGLSQNWTT
jgi:hypothetical protein